MHFIVFSLYKTAEFMKALQKKNHIFKNQRLLSHCGGITTIKYLVCILSVFVSMCFCYFLVITLQYWIVTFPFSTSVPCNEDFPHSINISDDSSFNKAASVPCN